MKLDRGSTDQLMALAAHRYCLVQHSYIVGACIAWVRQTWDQFEPNTQTVMLRDTIKGLADGNAGSPTIDAPEWRKLCAWMIEKMTPEQITAALVRGGAPVGTRAYENRGEAMMPPLPDIYDKASAREIAVYSRSQLIAYGKAVAEACAAKRGTLEWTCTLAER